MQVQQDPLTRLRTLYALEINRPGMTRTRARTPTQSTSRQSVPATRMQSVHDGDDMADEADSASVRAFANRFPPLRVPNDVYDGDIDSVHTNVDASSSSFDPGGMGDGSISRHKHRGKQSQRHAHARIASNSGFPWSNGDGGGGAGNGCDRDGRLRVRSADSVRDQRGYLGPLLESASSSLPVVKEMEDAASESLPTSAAATVYHTRRDTDSFVPGFDPPPRDRFRRVRKHVDNSGGMGRLGNDPPRSLIALPAEGEGVAEVPVFTSHHHRYAHRRENQSYGDALLPSLVANASDALSSSLPSQPSSSSPYVITKDANQGRVPGRPSRETILSDFLGTSKDQQFQPEKTWLVRHADMSVHKRALSQPPIYHTRHLIPGTRHVAQNEPLHIPLLDIFASALNQSPPVKNNASASTSYQPHGRSYSLTATNRVNGWPNTTTTSSSFAQSPEIEAFLFKDIPRNLINPNHKSRVHSIDAAVMNGVVAAAVARRGVRMRNTASQTMDSGVVSAAVSTATTGTSTIPQLAVLRNKFVQTEQDSDDDGDTVNADSGELTHAVVRHDAEVQVVMERLKSREKRQTVDQGTQADPIPGSRYASRKATPLPSSDRDAKGTETTSQVGLDSVNLMQTPDPKSQLTMPVAAITTTPNTSTSQTEAGVQHQPLVSLDRQKQQDEKKIPETPEVVTQVVDTPVAASDLSSPLIPVIPSAPTVGRSSTAPSALESTPFEQKIAEPVKKITILETQEPVDNLTVVEKTPKPSRLPRSILKKQMVTLPKPDHASVSLEPLPRTLPRPTTAAAPKPEKHASLKTPPRSIMRSRSVSSTSSSGSLEHTRDGYATSFRNKPNMHFDIGVYRHFCSREGDESVGNGNVNGVGSARREISGASSATMSPPADWFSALGESVRPMHHTGGGVRRPRVSIAGQTDLTPLYENSDENSAFKSRREGQDSDVANKDAATTSTMKSDAIDKEKLMVETDGDSSDDGGDMDWDDPAPSLRKRRVSFGSLPQKFEKQGGDGGVQPIASDTVKSDSNLIDPATLDHVQGHILYTSAPIRFNDLSPHALASSLYHPSDVGLGYHDGSIYGDLRYMQSMHTGSQYYDAHGGVNESGYGTIPSWTTDAMGMVPPHQHSYEDLANMQMMHEYQQQQQQDAFAVSNEMQWYGDVNWSEMQPDQEPQQQRSSARPPPYGTKRTRKRRPARSIEMLTRKPMGAFRRLYLANNGLEPMVNDGWEPGMFVGVPQQIDPYPMWAGQTWQ